MARIWQLRQAVSWAWKAQEEPPSAIWQLKMEDPEAAFEAPVWQLREEDQEGASGTGN